MNTKTQTNWFKRYVVAQSRRRVNSLDVPVSPIEANLRRPHFATVNLMVNEYRNTTGTKNADYIIMLNQYRDGKYAVVTGNARHGASMNYTVKGVFDNLSVARIKFREQHDYRVNNRGYTLTQSRSSDLSSANVSQIIPPQTNQSAPNTTLAPNASPSRSSLPVNNIVDFRLTPQLVDLVNGYIHSQEDKTQDVKNVINAIIPKMSYKNGNKSVLNSDGIGIVSNIIYAILESKYRNMLLGMVPYEFFHEIPLTKSEKDMIKNHNRKVDDSHIEIDYSLDNIDDELTEQQK